MDISKLIISKSTTAAIEGLRKLFLAETDFQFVYNKCHGAGWADVYLFTVGGTEIGYGSVWGKDRREDRDTVFEFFVTVPYRKNEGIIFRQFLHAAAATYIECQSNDVPLAHLTYQYAKNINAEAILFEDAFETDLAIPGVSFSQRGTGSDSEYELSLDGNVVATGGYVWNYNFPYIDIYYAVPEEFRRRGFGALMTQELKREAYRLKRIPSARCNIVNQASKATLLKAGMRICGNILVGEILPDRVGAK